MSSKLFQEPKCGNLLVRKPVWSDCDYCLPLHSLFIQPRLKRRLDGNQGDRSTPDVTDNEGPAAKAGNAGTTSEINFSVRIEQQDNNVKLDVHATVGSKAESSVETTTSVKCEQKQSPDDCSNENETLSPPDDISINEEDIDFIFSMVGNNHDENLLEEITKFEKICQSKFDDSNNSNDSKMYPLMKSPGLANNKLESHSPVFNGNQKFPGSSPHLQNYRSPPVSMSESTLPAAETLKQLAANHQSQSQSTGSFQTYPGHHMTPDANQYPPNSGYPPNYDPPNPSHYNHNQGPYMNNNMHGHVPFNQSKTEPGLTYNGTKPLTHYQANDPVSVQQPQPPSSLQQLQNQVQSHFSQSPQMEITQTQHVQVSDGPNRMQMSQTQQVHMRQPQQQMSISQQQSFSVPGANMAPNNQNNQYMNEQMKMQMMQEKMRRDRQAQARSLLESQRQQQQQQQQQQQYMNRPPPEYKMQQSAPEGYPGSDMGPNPLQTMQNMVNQTNTMPPAQYSHIKSESASVQMPNGMMQSHQVTAMQQRVGGGGHMPDMQQGNHPYPMQRQQSYPGAQPHPPRPQRHPPESSFTSSIMRNQRPPNVNVGPDGLNISQPRSDWQRPMMNQQMPRQPMPSGMPQMGAQVGMMQYQYANQNGMGGTGMPGMQGPASRPMQMASMQSQPMMTQSHQMMMRQSMQMSQRMGMRAGPMDAPNQMPNGSNHEDIINLFEGAGANSNPELLDTMTVQSSDPNNDAAWLDEILGGKWLSEDNRWFIEIIEDESISFQIWNWNDSRCSWCKWYLHNQ